MPTVKDRSKLPTSQGWYAYIEEKGVTLGPGHNWQYIKQLVGSFLDKNGMNVGDREQYLHKAVCAALTRDNRSGMCIEPYRTSLSQTKTRAYELDARMPKGLKKGKPGYDGLSWGVWHLAARDGKLTPSFARELVARIGCGACRSHATRHIQKNPVPAPDQVFAWSVSFHNAINAKLGKPIVTLEQASQLWKQ